MITFIGTNVLVYLFDADAPEKKERALEQFATITLAGQAVLSTQVLQEFFVIVTRTLQTPLPIDPAEQVVAELSSLPIVSVDAPLVLRAIARQRTNGYAFSDSLIIEAAVAGGAERLLTEDLQHGQIVDGLRIENPFMGG
jgi:predicted nucleic acid-binding protein